MEMEMFEKASRLKLRFNSTVGSISAEDLWDLPLSHLDDMAKDLSKQVENAEVSFIKKPTRAKEIPKLQFQIILHVINVRLAEVEAAENAQETKAKKQKLLEVLARKKDASLEEASAEEIEAMIAEL